MLQADSASASSKTSKSFIVLNSERKSEEETMSNKPKYGLQDLTDSFKYFLIFGRIIGVIPIKGFQLGRVGGLKFRKASIPVITNIIIVIGLGFACCTGIFSFFKSHRSNVNELTNYLGFFQLYGTGFFIYFYFLLYSEDFINTLKKWTSIRLYYPYQDINLKREAHGIAAIILVSIFFENLLWHMRAFTLLEYLYLHQLPPPSNHTTDFFHFLPHHNSSLHNSQRLTLESFYNEAMDDWSGVYSYSPYIAIFAAIINKFALYAWNFYDILIIITSRAIYKKFKILNETGHKFLEAYEKSCETELENVNSFKSSNDLINLINDHLALTNLLLYFDEFFSPIILVSYGSNIYDICTHIANGLSPGANISLTASIYAAWSFLHLTARIFMVTLSAAKINEHALGISKVLRRCPFELYSQDIKKFETQLFHLNVGLGAFGTFVISKPFMLQILGVIFTIEIVLLQQNSICVDTK